MGDFEGKIVDRPLVAGSIVGVRAFRFTSNGYLEPAFWTDYRWTDYRWESGENKAQCLMLSRAHRLLGYEPSWMRTWRADHGTPNPGCSCGFYAYNKRGMQQVMGNHGKFIQGLIEGYGKVLVGDLGFKAEKAKVIALVDEGLDPRLWIRFLNSRIWLLIWTLLLVNAMRNLIAAFNEATSNWRWGYWPLVAAIAAIIGVRWWYHFMGYSHSGRKKILKKVRENYPDVEWFPSIEAAMKKHPVHLEVH